MKKIIVSFLVLPFFFLLTTPVSADWQGSFTASNVCYNAETNELRFHASDYVNVSQVGDFQGTGISNTNDLLNAGENTEFWSYVSGSYEDPHDFQATLSINPYRPSAGTVYVWFNLLGSANRMYSQPLTYPTDLESCDSSEVKIAASPSTGDKTVGQPFTVDVKVEDSGEAFNAARANVSVSSNLTVTGIHNATANACNLQYTKTPTKENPSFAGAIFGSSSSGCTVYTMTLTPNAEGTGTITFSNGSVKAYSDNSEIMTGVTNASFTLGNGATATPTPLLEFQVTNPLLTYKTNFNLTGTKLDTITQIFVNGSEEDSTYPTSTTWEVPVTLSLGENNFTLYGKDESNNQTATQTVTVDRHTLGDINGDGEINLIDASLFAVDWDKTEDLTYILSDMNDDGQVDLTDLSILAKLQ